MKNKFAVFIDFDDVLIHSSNKVQLDRSRTRRYTAADFKFESRAVYALGYLCSYIEQLGYGVVLVLSTSWIKYASRYELQKLLFSHFNRFWVDDNLTFSCLPIVKDRRQRIENWLLEHSDVLKDSDSFIIIDDSSSGTGLVHYCGNTADQSSIDARTFKVDYRYQNIDDGVLTKAAVLEIINKVLPTDPSLL